MIGDVAFNGCPLKELNIPQYVESIGYNAFSARFNTITVDKNNKKFDSRENSNALIETSSNTLIMSSEKTVIPDSVSVIGDYAFSGHDKLKEITIPSSVKTIEFNAFNGCDNLEKINFSEGLVNIRSCAFEGCSSLKEIRLPDSLETIGNSAFSNCTDIGSIYIPKNLKETELQNVFELDSVTRISVAEGNKYYDGRDYCNAVIETSSNTLIMGSNNATIPESVTAVGEAAFSNCVKMTEISVPSSVKTIGEYAFADCKSLKKIDLSEGLISIEKDVFEGCSSLSGIKLPDSVETIMEGAFSDCEKLSSIYIPKNLKKTDLINVFDLSSVTTVSVADGNQYYDSRDNCNAVIETSSNKLVLGSNNTKIPGSVTAIGEYAFSGCVNMKEITIPSSVKTIENSAFNDCEMLGKINMSEGLITIESEAFSGCGSLKDIKLPDSVETIGQWAFSSCEDLENIYIPKNLKKTDLSEIFACECIKKISVAEGNKYYDSRNNCNAVIETASDTIILACENTVIPNTVKTIGELSFQSTPSNLVIPEGVEKIEEHACDCQDNLKTVTLPSSLKSIGEDAFNSKNLETVNYRGSMAQWKKIKMADDMEDENWLTGVKINYNYKG